VAVNDLKLETENLKAGIDPESDYFINNRKAEYQSRPEGRSFDLNVP